MAVNFKLFTVLIFLLFTVCPFFNSEVFDQLPEQIYVTAGLKKRVTQQGVMLIQRIAVFDQHSGFFFTLLRKKGDWAGGDGLKFELVLGLKMLF